MISEFFQLFVFDEARGWEGERVLVGRCGSGGVRMRLLTSDVV